MEEKPASAPETKPEATEKQKNNDLRIFAIALLTSIIAIALYHFGMGAYKIYFPECEESYSCEEAAGEAVEGGPADEVRPPKGKKDGKPHQPGKDGKQQRKSKKGKKADQGKADAQASEKAQEKTDAQASETAPAEPAK